MHPYIQRTFTLSADALIDRLPQPLPAPERQAQCRIVSHRGQHDNRTCLENTMAAFERVADAGVWGIELDIRWTSDLQPVVFHDEDLLRLYGADLRIDGITLTRLRDQYAAIPTLAQVVTRFGRRVHLMIEVKQEPWRDHARQAGRLQEILRPLEPARDYHLLSIHPGMLAPFSGLPSNTLVAISDAWPARLSQWVLDHRWGGLCGHYLLLHSAMARRHHERHQAVGTGFAGSYNCLFRELNRGIDWIFSNDAVGLQAMVDEEFKWTSLRHGIKL